jgi:hypothetical protein
MEYKDFLEIVKINSPEFVVQRYILDEPPFAFRENMEQYYELRKLVCEKFGIHYMDFSIIGSAKLGFSLNPDKIGKAFSEDSDIDIAIISNQLFDKVWTDLIEYRNSNTIDIRLDPETKRRFDRLQWTMFFGHIRPDQMPKEFDFCRDWWKFFENISRNGKFGYRKTRGRLYRSWIHVSWDCQRSVKEIVKRIRKSEGKAE